MRLYLASTSPARLATLRAAGIEPIVVPSDVDEEAGVRAWEAGNGPISASAMVELLARAKATAVLDRTVDGEQIDGFVLGGDSAFELDGVIYGKPHTPEVARERWMLQRGRTGHLHSGHWLIDRRLGAPVASGSAVPAGSPITSGTPFPPAFPAAPSSPGGPRTPGTGAGSPGAHGSTGAAGSPSSPGAPGSLVSQGAGLVSTAAVTFASNITDAEVDAYIATGEPLAVAGAFTIDSLGAPFITSVDGDPHAVVGLSLATLRTLLIGFGVSWPELWNRTPA